MLDVLLPRTDAAIVLQVVLTIVIGTPLVLALYRRRATDLVWFVGGLELLLLGFYAYRTVH